VGYFLKKEKRRQGLGHRDENLWRAIKGKQTTIPVRRGKKNTTSHKTGAGNQPAYGLGRERYEERLPPAVSVSTMPLFIVPLLIVSFWGGKLRNNSNQSIARNH
jgi:hypothetical protein